MIHFSKKNNINIYIFRHSDQELSESVTNKTKIIPIGIETKLDDKILIYEKVQFKQSRTQEQVKRRRKRRRRRRRRRRRESGVRCSLVAAVSRAVTGHCSILGTCRYQGHREMYTPVSWHVLITMNNNMFCRIVS